MVYEFAFNAGTLSWGPSQTPTITQDTQISDVLAANFTIQSQAPYASATTNKNPGDIIFNVPAPVSGGIHGTIHFQDSGTDFASLNFDGTVVSTLTLGYTRVYQGSDGLNLSPFLVDEGIITLNGTDILLNEPLVFRDNLFYEGTTAPLIAQEDATSDVRPNDFTISAQAPFASATSETTPGNLILAIPPPTSGFNTEGAIVIQRLTENVNISGGSNPGNPLFGFGADPADATAGIIWGPHDALFVRGNSYYVLRADAIRDVSMRPHAFQLEADETIDINTSSDLNLEGDLDIYLTSNNYCTLQTQMVNFNDTGINYAYRTITFSPYTVDPGGVNHDYMIFTDSTSTPIAITLPVPTAGRLLKFKDSTGQAATNNVTILPNSVETIDGASSYILNINYQGVELQSDGTNWFVTSKV